MNNFCQSTKHFSFALFTTAKGSRVIETNEKKIGVPVA
jgi:hypothetical protein